MRNVPISRWPHWATGNRDDLTIRGMRALYWLWALFWLLMTAVSVQDHISNPYIKWWEPLLWEGSSCVCATAWLVLQQRGARALDRYLSQPLKWFGLHMAW